MIIRLGCVLAACCLFASCGKGPAPAASDEPIAGADGGQPGDGDALETRPTAGESTLDAPNAQSPIGEADINAALERMTRALRKYSFERRRVPQNFAELVAAGYVDDAPPPPSGHAFAIQPKTMQVILVKE
jgi:hypothetical protein